MVLSPDEQEFFYQQAQLFIQSDIIRTYADIKALLGMIGDENLGAFEVEVPEDSDSLELRLPWDPEYIHYKMLWRNAELWVYVNGSNIALPGQVSISDSLKKIRRHLQNYLSRLIRKGIVQTAMGKV